MCEAGHEDGYEWLGMNGARAKEGVRAGWDSISDGRRMGWGKV